MTMPQGLGVFARGSIPAGPWRHVFVNAWDRNAQAMVDAAVRRGAQAFLFGMPGKFTPQTWRAGLAYLRGKMASMRGVAGYMVDVETGWDGGGHGAEATALGAELAHDAARGWMVGFTGFPFLGVLAELAAAVGDAVFAMVQIYGRTSQDPATLRQWFERWHSHFGSRLLLAIAGWASSAPLATPSGFAAYLDVMAALPVAARAVWTEGRIPAYMQRAIGARFGVVFGGADPAEVSEGGTYHSPGELPTPPEGTRRGEAAVGALAAVAGTGFFLALAWWALGKG